MAYLAVDLQPILRNASYYRSLADAQGLLLTAVTKFCSSDPAIVRALHEGGIRSIADSNMSDFSEAAEALRGLKPGLMKKNLIKTRLSDIKAIPSLPPASRPDRVFVSDPELLAALRDVAAEDRPEIVLIVEIGDLKEGLYPEELARTAREFADLPISGVSANFACLSGRMPDMESLMILQALAKDLMAINGLERPFASVGGTVVHDFLEKGLLAGLAAEIRIGEGIFFGRDSSGGRALPGLEDSAFTLRGEILEMKEKRVAAAEHSGHNALGKASPAAKAGLRRRAILDFGVLAAESSDLFALDPGVEIAGQTYDFTVADLTDSTRTYHAGGYVDFKVHYAGASRAFLNKHLARSIERG
jgi:ornithine racemase